MCRSLLKKDTKVEILISCWKEESEIDWSKNRNQDFLEAGKFSDDDLVLNLIQQNPLGKLARITTSRNQAPKIISM